MALYKFRCPYHGDFLVEQPMSETTRTTPCDFPLGHDWNEGASDRHADFPCNADSVKVLGGALQFTLGKDAFHDGIEGTGETNNEVGKRWREEFKTEKGYYPEPAGARWV